MIDSPSRDERTQASSSSDSIPRPLTLGIEAKNLMKRFGPVVALEGVDLAVPTGALTALLGPSGSGKTTLLRVIAGLERLDSGSGRVRFQGVDVTDLPPGERGVGFVFQHYALFGHLSVFENVAFGLRVRKNKPAESAIQDKVMDLLRRVQLEGLAKRYPDQLSGGQRQRIALARAIATDPKVLLLDEPFGALDAKVRRELRSWLREFHEAIGLTTLFVTHDQDEALEIADTVVVMNHAKVEQVGSPRRVYDRPASPFVFEFLGAVNRLPLEDGGARYVRPHEIQLVPASDGAAEFVAVIRHIQVVGSIVRVQLQRAGDQHQIAVELSRREAGSIELRRGERIGVKVDKSESFPGSK